MAIHLPADPPAAEIALQSVFWRVHRRGRDPLWFGRTGKSRFDAPSGEYGVCYLGGSLGVAIVETLVRGKRLPVIPRKEMEQRSASSVVAGEPLRVLRLEGEGLPSFGISAHQVAGPDHGECRDLALRVWEIHPELDGIQYRSRWDHNLCWAIFDRAAAKLALAETHWLGDPTVAGPALRPYKHVSVI